MSVEAQWLKKMRNGALGGHAKVAQPWAPFRGLEPVRRRPPPPRAPLFVGTGASAPLEVRVPGYESDAAARWPARWGSTQSYDIDTTASYYTGHNGARVRDLAAAPGDPGGPAVYVVSIEMPSGTYGVLIEGLFNEAPWAGGSGGLTEVRTLEFEGRRLSDGALLWSGIDTRTLPRGTDLVWPDDGTDRSSIIDAQDAAFVFDDPWVFTSYVTFTSVIAATGEFGAIGDVGGVSRPFSAFSAGGYRPEARPAAGAAVALRVAAAAVDYPVHNHNIFNEGVFFQPHLATPASQLNTKPYETQLGPQPDDMTERAVSYWFPPGTYATLEASFRFMENTDPGAIANRQVQLIAATVDNAAEVNLGEWDAYASGPRGDLTVTAEGGSITAGGAATGNPAFVSGRPFRLYLYIYPGDYDAPVDPAATYLRADPTLDVFVVRGVAS
jgi:hypothetical protein